MAALLALPAGAHAVDYSVTDLADTGADGSMAIRNTIIAEPDGGINCVGVTSSGFNWSSDDSCDWNGTTDIHNGGDPNLLALADPKVTTGQILWSEDVLHPELGTRGWLRPLS